MGSIAALEDLEALHFSPAGRSGSLRLAQIDSLRLSFTRRRCSRHRHCVPRVIPSHLNRLNMSHVQAEHKKRKKPSLKDIYMSLLNSARSKDSQLG
jgi:hypothetical protein